jgi:hypothetical protein
MPGSLSRRFNSARNRALGWTALGLAIGLSIGLFLSPSVTSLLHPSSTSPAITYPLFCSDPNPITGWHYYVVYDGDTGAITSFSGGNGNGTPIPGPGQALLMVNTSSYSNQTLLHSMYCYAEQGHPGAFPFYVDLTTKEVVWD